MKIFFRALMSLFLGMLLFFYFLEAMIDVPHQIIHHANGKTVTLVENYVGNDSYKWLKAIVPSVNIKHWVLVELKPGEANPKINPITGAANFWYADPTVPGAQAPEGLYHWREDENPLVVNKKKIYGLRTQPSQQRIFAFDVSTGMYKQLDNSLKKFRKVSYDPSLVKTHKHPSSNWFSCKNPRSCGLIPYVHEKGEIFFLLGRDKHRKGLTDFGGLRDDEEPMVAAAREGHEETMGIFSGTHDDPGKREQEGIKFFLNKLDEGMKAYNNPNRYWMYFVDVTAQVELLGGLNSVIILLNQTSKILAGKVKSHFLEKIDFTWVSYTDLLAWIDTKKDDNQLLFEEFKKTIQSPSGLGVLTKIKQVNTLKNSLGQLEEVLDNLKNKFGQLSLKLAQLGDLLRKRALAS